MKLNELIDADIFEDRTHEFKSRLNEKEPISWLKTVSAFANTLGGEIYLGVDNDENLNGFLKEEVDHEIQFFNMQLTQHLSPKPSCFFEYLPYPSEGGKRYIIKIVISSSSNKPVYLTYKGTQSVFLRDQGYVRLASREEIGNMYRQSENFPFDMQLTSIKYDRKNFTKLFEKYAENTGKELNEKALSAIGFFNEEGFLRMGGLFFQDDFQNDALLIKACQWPSIDRATNIFLHPETCNKSLLDEVDFSLKFIQEHSINGYQKLASSRKNIFSYPARSVFEAVINAVVHRNYFLPGTFIQIDIFKDRLEISSPGSLPNKAESTEKIYDISSIRPQSRNPLISKTFELLKMMEALGTGFDKITEDYSGYGDTHRPFIVNNSGSFIITLPDITFADGVLSKESIPQIAHSIINEATEYDDKILSYCFMQPREASEIAKYLGLTLSTYLRNNILGNLVKQDFLLVVKEKKRKQYKSNKDKVFIV